jgi:uncharacterized membrane protein YeaQ/YmgE (transglycosylase-associated protein family)
MNILLMLIIGGLIGWLAAALSGREEGIVASIIIGIIGSFIGGFLSALTTGSTISMSFSWPGLFWSFIGSLVLVAILNMAQHRPHTTHHPHM